MSSQTQFYDFVPKDEPSNIKHPKLVGENTLFLSIEYVSQTFWVVSKCVYYMLNAYVLEILDNMKF